MLAKSVKLGFRCIQKVKWKKKTSSLQNIITATLERPLFSYFNLDMRLRSSNFSMWCANRIFHTHNVHGWIFLLLKLVFCDTKGPVSRMPTYVTQSWKYKKFFIKSLLTGDHAPNLNSFIWLSIHTQRRMLVWKLQPRIKTSFIPKLNDNNNFFHDNSINYIWRTLP